MQFILHAKNKIKFSRAASPELGNVPMSQHILLYYIINATDQNISQKNIISIAIFIYIKTKIQRKLHDSRK